MNDNNLRKYDIAVLDINFSSVKENDVVTMKFTKAAIYDLNEECILSGPENGVTLDVLADNLKKYDIIFFKGGIVEVGFIRRFVSDSLKLINLERLGCPNYDALIRNPRFVEIDFKFRYKFSLFLQL